MSNVASPNESGSGTSVQAAKAELVPFHGGALEAARVGEVVWVSVRRACEALGLDSDSQRKKLSDPVRAPWACTVVMTVHDTTGRNQEAFCLDLDSFPMWLATIDSSRVSEAARPKVILFQREAARALRDHFFGPRVAVPPKVTPRRVTRHRSAVERLDALARATAREGLSAGNVLDARALFALARLMSDARAVMQRMDPIDAASYLQGASSELVRVLKREAPEQFESPRLPQASTATADFVSERCVFDVDARSSCREMRASYDTWCAQTGEQPLTARAFWRLLRERGARSCTVRVDGRPAEGLAGVRLNAN